VSPLYTPPDKSEMEETISFFPQILWRRWWPRVQCTRLQPSV
jgi:hypothetical protein